MAQRNIKYCLYFLFVINQKNTRTEYKKNIRKEYINIRISKNYFYSFNVEIIILYYFNRNK